MGSKIMKDIKVSLNWREIFSAAEIGISRHIESEKKGLKNKHGLNSYDGWRVNIEGAIGELAYAKAMNKFWPMSVNTFKSIPDVDQEEIRTRSEDYYDLLVRDDDPDDRIYVLVTGKIPNFIVRGWMLGRDAKQTKWKKNYANRPPAYFVPQAFLHDLNDIS